MTTYRPDDIIRAKCMTDMLFCTRYFFREQEGRQFVVGEHHRRIAEALDSVFQGEITRLIINMPPRYSKTEMAVKMFIARGLALNPASKYIHLSYSGALALDTSEQTKGIVTSDWYRRLFPEVRLTRESQSKQKWYTTDRGGVYATSSGGQVTGFGAGLAQTSSDGEIDDFTARGRQGVWGGAIIIDDPLKPEDAFSAVVREKVNQRFETTIRSRANSRQTPIIVIMQRLHRHDLTGYLLETEPDVWTVLSFPALTMAADGTEQALYPEKHTVEELHRLRDANRFVFETQYQQNPTEATDRRWLFAFNRERNVGRTEYHPRLPLYASFDFNRNPLTCSLWQITPEATLCVDTVRLEDATTRQVCQEIERRYPHAMLIVTGDAAGAQRTTMSAMNNFQEIKAYFRLSEAQMRVSRQNPRLAESYLFMNSVFEQHPIIVDAERCRPLIYDFENVMTDEEHRPVKTSRQNEAQQADFLDNARYFFHAFYKLIP